MVTQPTVSVSLETLRKRADFLLAARNRRTVTPGFVLQARERTAADQPGVIRVGFTCSRKVGNAVARNRARRRLRETARLILPKHGRPGWDYVLIGRAGVTATLPFSQLLADLKRALRQVHSVRPAPSHRREEQLETPCMANRPSSPERRAAADMPTGAS